MLIEIGLIILGLVMIGFCADMMTDGASAIAKRFHIPQIIIGLTIVAFGTSAPELVVSVFGTLEDAGGIAVGNVIGSNIFNCLAILGLTAIITPLPVERNSIRFDIPIAIIAGIALLLVVSDPWLEGQVSTISRTEGMFLTFLGILFISYTVVLGRKSAKTAKALQGQQVETDKGSEKTSPLYVDILNVVGGILGLVVGGRIFVQNASVMASLMGVSDTLIGLTLVSWGTSLPELATSAVAAIKKNSGIAVGNIVGSNIFNVFFVLGIAGTVKPLTRLEFTSLDILMQLVAILLTYVVAKYIGKNKINRWEGALMLSLFIAYNVYIISNALIV